MSTALEQIEQQIAKLSSKAVKKNTGTIRTVADGVAKIDGLSEVMYNEMVQFPGGAIGIALNLEEDEVGCVVLGDVSKLKEGDEVTAVIVNVDRKTRNIQLSIKAKDAADQQEAMASLNQQAAQNAGTTSLGALLRAKLDNNGN